MPDARIRAVITADDQASRVLAGFDNHLGKIGTTLRHGVVAGAAVAGAAIAGLTAFAVKSIQAFAEEELAVTRLQAGINNVTSARSKDISALIQQASALQRVTRFSDEQVISAQGILTTFQLNQEAIAALTPRLIDMSEGIARVSGGLPDLEGNAMLVAKALGGEDVTGLVGALRRVGVIMTEHQTQVLTTGNMQERLATITQVLDQNFKGLGEAAGTTAAGKFAILQNAVGDLQEKFGGALATALTPFIDKLTAWAQTPEAQQKINEIANAVGNMITQFASFVHNNWPQIKYTLSVLKDSAFAVRDAFEAVNNAIRTLMDLSNRAAQITGRIIKFLSGDVTGNRRQMGGPVTGHQPYIVGERGPELFVPGRSGRVISNDKLSAGGGGGSLSFNVNIGMYAGTPLERRKIAQQMFEDLKDVANSKGISLEKMVARG